MAACNKDFVDNVALDDEGFDHCFNAFERNTNEGNADSGAIVNDAKENGNSKARLEDDEDSASMTIIIPVVCAVLFVLALCAAGTYFFWIKKKKQVKKEECVKSDEKNLPGTVQKSIPSPGNDELYYWVDPTSNNRNVGKVVTKTIFQSNGTKKVVEECVQTDGSRTITETIYNESEFIIPPSNQHEGKGGSFKEQDAEEDEQQEEEFSSTSATEECEHGDMIIPQSIDVCFGNNKHPGTKELKRLIADSMDEFVDVECFDKHVYKTLQKKLKLQTPPRKHRRFLIEGSHKTDWRKATTKECVRNFRKYFNKEQKRYYE